MIDDVFIAKIHANCEEDCGCLLWRGRRSHSQVPRWGDKSLRRVMFEAVFGEIPAKRLASTTCGNPLCLNTDHMTLKSKSAVLKHTYETTDLRLRRAVTSTRESRKAAKLDPIKAREIRNSDETLDILAARYGVNRTLCSRIKRGEAWKEANPFAGLVRQQGARA